MGNQLRLRAARFSLRAGLASLPALCAATLLSLALPSAAAHAEITRVVVEDTGFMGAFGDRDYRWVTGMLEGYVERDDGTIGQYRVPISLNYPDRNSNGFGFVDVVNNSAFTRFLDENTGLGRPEVSYTGDKVFSDFLRREGFSYLSVQWYKTVIDILGPAYGVIERASDGYMILQDAARLLRTLDIHFPDLVVQPPALRWVVGHGQSTSAALLRGLVWTGMNRESGGSLWFDGFILTGHNAQRCRLLINDGTPQMEPSEPQVPTYLERVDCLSLPNDGKLITVQAQSEIENLGGRFGDSANERVYDVAGISHIPEFSRSLRFAGAPRQNPVSWQPVAKAMLLHLLAWIEDDVQPPEPVHLEGQYDESGRFQLAVDADGNALGGIRLPHMSSVSATREPAGAPLGVYGGIDYSLDPAEGFGFARLGGTFLPFSLEELARRYPTLEGYVELIRKAADTLVLQGLILPEDRDAYVRTAQQGLAHH